MKALEQERLEAEKRQLEEQRRLREEARRKEEQRRKELELAKQQERERKEREKARKREERERKEAAAAEKRKQEKEAKRLREEERRKEALMQKEAKAAPAPATPDEKPELWATRAMHPPVPVAPKPTAKDAYQAEQKSVPATGLLAWAATKRNVIYAAGGVLLVLAAVVLWRLLVPHTIAINVTTVPDGASVTITTPKNPKFKRECVTPNCSLDLPPGTYSLDIRREGSEPSNQTIQVDAKGTHTFPVTLVAIPPIPGPGPGPNPTPHPEQKFATLQLRGLQPGSDLKLDGKSVGRVDQNGEKSIQVQAGEHRMKVLAKNQNSITLVRNFVAGQVVSLGRDDLYPPTPPAPEDLDWQKVLDSTPTIASLDKFLGKYPNGKHHAEASDMLESLDWGKDSHANTADAYREYLGRFPQGSHAAAAEEELAFVIARNQRDPATLDGFIAKYPASRHRAEIDGLRDDAAWQRINRDDEGSLNSYVSAFPRGSHVGEAKGRLGELQDEGTWQRTNRSDENSLNAYMKAFPNGKHSEVASDLIAKMHAAPNPSVGKTTKSNKELDEAAIRALMKGYEQAFDSRSADALLKIWPNMGTKKYKEYKNTFSAVSAVSMEVEIRSIDFSENGDTATANSVLSQAIKVNGGGGNQPAPRKDPAVFELTKSNGKWIINNVR